MAIDKTKLAFSSTTEIDHLVAQGTQDVGAGTTALYSIPNVTTPPAFEVQFKPSGAGYWEDGMAHPYIEGGTLFVNAPQAGTCRYFIWSDRLNY